MATIISRILVRRDTQANWDAANPVLQAGEFALDTTNHRARVGDGVNPFNSLPFMVDSGRSVLTNSGITGGGTLAQDRTLSLTGNALALHNLATTGIVARTGSGAMAIRTLQGGGDITITNPGGVAGDPSIAVNLATLKPVKTDTDQTITGIKTFNGATRGGISTIASATAITLDLATSNRFVVTMAENITFANPTNIPAAGQSFIIVLKQDGTGSRLATWGAYFKFPYAAAPGLSSEPNTIDVIVCEVLSSTEILCNICPALG